MTEEAAAARPVGILVKTARRVAVALTISTVVGLLLYNLSKSAPSSFFFRAIVLGLSATTAFVLFEVWPRKLPHWLQRWVLQVVAVGVSVPVTLFAMYFPPPPGAPPFLEHHDWMLLTHLALLAARAGRAPEPHRVPARGGAAAPRVRRDRRARARKQRLSPVSR